MKILLDSNLMKTSPDYMKKKQEGIPDKLSDLTKRLQKINKLLILKLILMQS
jgi:hypothetical protein